MKLYNNEFTRFLFWGVINTVLGYAIYYLLLLFFNYTYAYSLAFVLGVCFSYYFNVRFSFQEKFVFKRFIQYPLVYVIQYFMGLSVLYFCVESLHVSQWIAPLLVTIITIPVTFLMSRLIIKRGIL